MLNNTIEENKIIPITLEGEYLELSRIIEKDIQNNIRGKTWDQIHIPNKIKDTLKEALILPLKYPDYFNNIIKPYKSKLFKIN